MVDETGLVAGKRKLQLNPPDHCLAGALEVDFEFVAFYGEAVLPSYLFLKPFELVGTELEGIEQSRNTTASPLSDRPGHDGGDDG